MMSNRPSPVHLLLMLLAGAVAVSGWFYGWHWKRVATGEEPTQEEALIIQLQDQLNLLRAENDRLSGQLRETPSETEPTIVPESIPPE